MRYVWLSGVRRLEVLKAQVDDGGYDIVLESVDVVRHVQLKSSFSGSAVRRFQINSALARKLSGCVICMRFDLVTLELGPFYWFGAAPGSPLPALDRFPHVIDSKATAGGVKGIRPNLRSVPLSAFERVESIPLLAVRLFGQAVAHAWRPDSADDPSSPGEDDGP